MELSNTAYVILGLLRKGAKSGYEIKSIVEAGASCVAGSMLRPRCSRCATRAC
jgi:hypothetical protein